MIVIIPKPQIMIALAKKLPLSLSTNFGTIQIKTGNKNNIRLHKSGITTPLSKILCFII